MPRRRPPARQARAPGEWERAIDVFDEVAICARPIRATSRASSSVHRAVRWRSVPEAGVPRYSLDHAEPRSLDFTISVAPLSPAVASSSRTSRLSVHWSRRIAHPPAWAVNAIKRRGRGGDRGGAGGSARRHPGAHRDAGALPALSADAVAAAIVERLLRVHFGRESASPSVSAVPDQDVPDGTARLLPTSVSAWRPDRCAGCGVSRRRHASTSA